MRWLASAIGRLCARAQEERHRTSLTTDADSQFKALPQVFRHARV